MNFNPGDRVCWRLDRIYKGSVVYTSASQVFVLWDHAPEKGSYEHSEYQLCLLERQANYDGFEVDA